MPEIKHRLFPPNPTRRQLIRGALTVSAGIAAACAPNERSSSPPLQKFEDIKDRALAETVEYWNAALLENKLKDAVVQSLAEKSHVTVSLPVGEILIDRKITCLIPEGAS